MDPGGLAEVADLVHLRARAIAPEELLMIALLEQTMREIHFPARSEGLCVRQTARAWVESDEVGWVFAFARVCEHFGLHVAQTRRAILGPRGRRKPVTALPRSGQWAGSARRLAQEVRHG